MPRNKEGKELFRIRAAYIETIHDEGINLAWPGIEPVEPNTCLDLNLLESAAEQPFQAGYDLEFYPAIYDKASCLFFLIAGGHIFGNGNKRTGVIALDQFLLANSIYLLLSNDELHELAIETAAYKLNGRNHKNVLLEVSALIKGNSIPFREIRKEDLRAYRRFHRIKRVIQQYPTNQPDAIPGQRRLRG